MLGLLYSTSPSLSRHFLPEQGLPLASHMLLTTPNVPRDNSVNAPAWSYALFAEHVESIPEKQAFTVPYRLHVQRNDHPGTPCFN